jgi:DNA-binding CsgD family transcriptional regulator
MLAETDFRADLTPREREVLELTANGYSAKEVASLIGIAPRTVERHVETVRLKMHARNRVHMITQAVIRGVLKFGSEPAPPGEHSPFVLTAPGNPSDPPESPINDGLAPAQRK